MRAILVRNSATHKVIRGYIKLCEDANLVRCVGVAKRTNESNSNQILNALYQHSTNSDLISLLNELKF